MKYLRDFAVTALCVMMWALVALPAHAAPAPSPVAALISVEHDLNEMCRGWEGDTPQGGQYLEQVCKARDKAYDALVRLGHKPKD